MTSKGRDRPEFIKITAVSSDRYSMDAIIYLLPGGTVNVSYGLADGDKENKPFRVEMPGNLRDQQVWVSDSNGIRPATPSDIARFEGDNADV